MLFAFNIVSLITKYFQGYMWLINGDSELETASGLILLHISIDKKN